MKKPIHFDSYCAKEIKDNRSTKPHILPIYPTAAFEFETINEGIDIFSGKTKGHSYGRYGNPTVDTVAEKIAALETYGLGIDGAKALLFSSGMSAISTMFMALVEKGDKVLSQGNVYGATTSFLTETLAGFGVEAILTDLTDLDQVEAILKKEPTIKLMYFETPSNPTLSCVDLEALCELAKKYGKWTAIDNTFATPYLQQPFKYGLDFVIHSTTKFLNGHGNCISGIAIARDGSFMEKGGKVWNMMKTIGTNSNPWDAWLIYNGMKTLALRMEKHSDNAMAVAEFLQNHAQVERVNYCGLATHPDHQIAKKQMRKFGAMLSFELKGGVAAGIRFMNAIEFCTLAPTLGDVDTLILHPASMSHMAVPKAIRLQNGITDGLIRVSVGIENVEDIIDDLNRALKSV